jgi:hypothetical protein
MSGILHDDLSTFCIFDSDIHSSIVKKNLLLHFHGKIFNIHLSFHCKSHSCKMAWLIPLLKKADTNVTHCYVIHTLPILSSFCVYIRHVLSYIFHCQQCSFSYLLVSDDNVEAYQILVILTLLSLHGNCVYFWFYLWFSTNVLTFFYWCFYFSENAIKTAEKYLCSGITKRPLLLMQISTCCNNTEQLLESFQEVLKRIKDNYKGKQVSYRCARKCLRNKP